VTPLTDAQLTHVAWVVWSGEASALDVTIAEFRADNEAEARRRSFRVIQGGRT
jgi:hypothetical protein